MKIKMLTNAEKDFLSASEERFFDKYRSTIKPNDLKDIWGNAVDDYRVTSANPTKTANEKAEKLIEQFKGRC